MRPVQFGIDREHFDRHGEPSCKVVAGGKSHEQHDARARKNLPAQLSLPREQIAERENADLISGRIKRTGIEQLVKEQVTDAVDLDREAIPISLTGRVTTDELLFQSCPRSAAQPGQMKTILQPNSIPNSAAAPVITEVQR